MSSELAVQCTDLTKQFQLGELLSLKRTLNALVPRREDTSERFGALENISFEVPRGSFFGIVGSNGSGKSTLPQIISGITVPTSGQARGWGRVAPRLEVGSGFHDDLTGAENVGLLGAVLGLDPSEVRVALPRIAEFAGVERHLDTPLKRYSSGMRARLSFATAICFPADTYVFDEVLAVVDDDFRDQCVNEMRKLIDGGRTIIFMSHDLRLVTGICDQGMWLEKGHVRKVGTMDEVGAAYAAS